MAHGEAPEAEGGFRGEPRGEHGGEGEPGTQLSMDAMPRMGLHEHPQVRQKQVWEGSADCNLAVEAQPQQ